MKYGNIDVAFTNRFLIKSKRYVKNYGFNIFDYEAWPLTHTVDLPSNIKYEVEKHH